MNTRLKYFLIKNIKIKLEREREKDREIDKYKLVLTNNYTFGKKKCFFFFFLKHLSIILKISCVCVQSRDY